MKMWSKHGISSDIRYLGVFTTMIDGRFAEKTTSDGVFVPNKVHSSRG